MKTVWIIQNPDHLPTLPIASRMVQPEPDLVIQHINPHHYDPTLLLGREVSLVVLARLTLYDLQIRYPTLHDLMRAATLRLNAPIIPV